MVAILDPGLRQKQPLKMEQAKIPRFVSSINSPHCGEEIPPSYLLNGKFDFTISPGFFPENAGYSMKSRENKKALINFRQIHLW